MMPTPVIGYVRVSRVGDRPNLISPELQKEQIEYLAKRENLRVIETLEELDRSGRDSDRPLWNQALERVDNGEVRGIAVWNLTRFSRSLKDALTALDRIETAGGRLYSATEQFDDSPAGRMHRNIMLAVGENEAERAAVGFKAAIRNALDDGVFIGGTVPFGYVKGDNRRLTPDPMAAPIVQGLFERRGQGESWGKLVKWAEGQGKTLTTTGLEYMLRNRTYLGEVRHGADVKKDTHPALVGKALFKKCQYRGTRKSSRTGYLTGKYLLCGIARCGNCGHYLRLGSGNNRNGTKNAFYRCRNPKCSEQGHAQARPLDDYVVASVMGFMESYKSSRLHDWRGHSSCLNGAGVPPALECRIA